MRVGWGRRVPHSTRKPPGRDCLLLASSVRRPAQAGFVLIIFDAPIRRQGHHPLIGQRPRRGRARHPKPAPNPTCRNHRRPNRPWAISNLADGRLSGSRLRRSLSGGGGNLPLRCSGKPQAFTNPADGPPSGSRPTSLTFRSRQQPATPAFRQGSGLRQTHQQTVFGHTVLTLVSPVHLRRAMACCCCPRRHFRQPVKPGHTSGLRQFAPQTDFGRTAPTCPSSAGDRPLPLMLPLPPLPANLTLPCQKDAPLPS